MATPKYIDKHKSWIRNFWEHLKLQHSQVGPIKSILVMLPLLLGLSLVRWSVKWLKKYSSQEKYGMAIAYSLRRSEFGLLVAYLARLQRPDIMTFGSRLQRKRHVLEYGPSEFGFLGAPVKVKTVFDKGLYCPDFGLVPTRRTHHGRKQVLGMGRKTQSKRRKKHIRTSKSKS